MKYNIQEELEKFKLLTKYDSSKTLNENMSDLNEQTVPGSMYTAPTKTVAQTAQTASNITDPTVKKIFDECKKRTNAQATPEVLSGTVLINKGIKGPGTTRDELVAGFSKVKTLNDFCAVSNRYLVDYGESLETALNDEYQIPQNWKFWLLDLIPSVVSEVNSLVNKGVASKPKVVIPIPTELKDMDGVKSFQDWADANQAGWAKGFPEGKLNKGAGYGAFGPRTSKAWTAYGKEYLQAIQNRQVDTAINDVRGTLQAKTGQTVSSQIPTANNNQLRT